MNSKRKINNKNNMNKRKKKQLKSYSNESISVEILLGKITNVSIRQRVSNLLYTYIGLSNKNKKSYYRFTCTGILINNLIFAISSVNSEVVAAVFENMIKVLGFSVQVSLTDIAVLAFINNLIMGFTALFSYKEDWRIYHHAAESLKRECVLYINRLEMYANGKTRDMWFVNAVEEIAEYCERSSWENAGKKREVEKETES